jgi:cytochrome c553
LHTIVDEMKFFLLMLLAAAFTQSAAAQDTKSGAASAPGNAQANVSMCIGCHGIPGYQASFPYVYRVPKIGGQSQPYIEAALKAYRQGARNHPSMTAVAKALTDEQIAAVAAYYAARGAEHVVAATK